MAFCGLRVPRHILEMPNYSFVPRYFKVGFRDYWIISDAGGCIGYGDVTSEKFRIFFTDL